MYYKWILSYLNSLIERIEVYGDQNPVAQSQNQFIDCLIFIEEFRDEVLSTKNSNIPYTDTNNKERLVNHLESFLSSYPDFTGLLLNKLKLWVFISKAIESLLDPNPFGSLVSESGYKSYNLKENENLPIFIDEFSNDNGGMFILPLSSIQSLKSFLDDNLVDDHLLSLYIVLNELQSSENWDEGTLVILKVNNHANNNLKKIKAIVQLRILSKGIPIKPINRSNIIPSLPLKRTYIHAKNYEQFSEIIEIINELNNQEFLLDKYFKLYHIIENLMYRYRVNKLMLAKNNNLSVRDLQLISENFLKTEESVIKEFINECFNLTYDDNQSIEVLYSEYAKTLWDGLANNQSEINSINDILIKIRFTNKASDLYDYESIGSNFDGRIIARLIYKIRNSVVHNKDSEHHLYHTNLPPGVEKLIEDFLLPLLTNIIFHLLINHNNLIWYNKKTISLYR